ncbi:E3 ubiquitin-protein ligase CSU1 [Golovinomyces cichoracearum]|uniref:E3 ubiquitin-protein ligase CSU1 n=1 Tax=Golovinomyces cichoracearum TaxID=62708 RepID=A0A420HEZ1_9PEZI|nr:E3 ubiquitin-protein ligase CSU1 [Golovinomyces cichoracearum]
MSHSKRNTSRAVFTSYERTLAKAAWGTNSARLSRDSFLPFASCKLCLLAARNPVSCSHGDIFCKECALENILSQKREIKRLEKIREREQREAEEEKNREEAEVHLRYALEFDRAQIGLGSKLSTVANVTEENILADKCNDKEHVTRNTRGEKRKFELDQSEIMRITQEETNKTRKAPKTTLASFWAPSITPSSNTKNKLHSIAKSAKLFPICPASFMDKPHIYSLHDLIDVTFTEETDEKTGCKQCICPSCKKVLTNTSKAILIRICGHVLCKNCMSRLTTGPESCSTNASRIDSNTINCFVCDTNSSRIKEKTKNKQKSKNNTGLVEIRCEGTGFASGGVSIVEKAGVAFQC